MSFRWITNTNDTRPEKLEQISRMYDGAKIHVAKHCSDGPSLHDTLTPHDTNAPLVGLWIALDDWLRWWHRIHPGKTDRDALKAAYR